MSGHSRTTQVYAGDSIETLRSEGIARALEAFDRVTGMGRCWCFGGYCFGIARAISLVPAVAVKLKERGIMTPEEARARAKAILQSQKRDQVIQLNDDGTLAQAADRPDGIRRKRTVLHDPKGEYEF